jgi:anti-sigma factor RsiW
MKRRHTSNQRAVETYVDGEMSTPRRFAVATHLLMCPGCQEHAATVSAIKLALQSGSRGIGGPVYAGDS